jgi:ABC-type branched-subunit amino acid transport system ATPase component
MARNCLNDLLQREGPALAVDAFTVTLQPGKLTGFWGTNGAGTTTTPRMPVELTRPQAGNTARRQAHPPAAGPAIPGDEREDRFDRVPPAAQRTRHTARA